MISLKLDATFFHGKYYIGVNCQFCENYTINTVNIGIFLLEETSTSDHIKRRLEKSFGKFDIDMKQTFSITTENAANYLKIGKLFNRDLLTSLETAPEDMRDNILKDIIIDTENNKEEIHPNNIHSVLSNVQIVSCGVYSLQLVVFDSIESLPFAISAALKVVKNIKTPNITLDLGEK